MGKPVKIVYRYELFTVKKHHKNHRYQLKYYFSYRDVFLYLLQV